MSESPLASALARIPLFAQLPTALLQEIVSIAGTPVTLSRGRVLFTEGEAAGYLPILVAGRVKLFRTSSDGREQVLHLVRAPTAFGEAGVFGPGVFPASAAAVEPARVVPIPRADLLALLRRRPELALALLASLSVWLRRLVDLIDGLSLHTVEERVSAYLWAAFLRSREPLAAGLVIRLDEPKHTIAALCGTAPEVLSRTFHRFEAAHVVHVAGSLITLLDPDSLAARARLGESDTLPADR